MTSSESQNEMPCETRLAFLRREMRERRDSHIFWLAIICALSIMANIVFLITTVVAPQVGRC